MHVDNHTVEGTHNSAPQTSMLNITCCFIVHVDTRSGYRFLYVNELCSGSVCWKRKTHKARSEATHTVLEHDSQQVSPAKEDECGSWFEHALFERVDMREKKPSQVVTGRLMFTINRSMAGIIVTCKARWEPQSVQDKPKWDPQAACRTSTRFAFRLSCQHAVNQ